MSYDPNAAVDRRLIEVIFLVRAPAGDGCRKPSHSPGRCLGPKGLPSSRLGLSACALRLPPHSQLICGVTAREEFDTSLRLSLVKLALVSTQPLRSRKWMKLNG